jgi:non-structural maintenance of chromosomes element 1
MDSDSEDPAAGHYNDGNRAFLQAIMARGTLTLKEGKTILAAIFTVQDAREGLLASFKSADFCSHMSTGRETLPEDVTEADFDSYIAAASSALSPFDYEIRDTMHQVSKERVYAIVNSTSDPLTQLATMRAPEEIAYIKRILDAMFETYNTPRQEIMGVTSMQALKLTRGSRNSQSANGSMLEDGAETSQVIDKGLKQAEAENLLASLVTESWFERSKEGWYTLSPRALMELKSWLMATYNDPDLEDDDDAWQRIKLCVACKSIVTIGQRCTNLDCNVRLHDICHTAFWRTQREKKCPKCQKHWDGRHWVGEKAITTTEAYLKGKRRSGGSRRNEVVEDDAEGEQADED